MKRRSNVSKRIEELAEKLPARSVDSELAGGITQLVTSSVMDLVERLVSEQVKGITQGIKVEPKIVIPEIKIPPSTINVKVPESQQGSDQQPVKQWRFNIFRLDNGLIDSITATAERQGD